VALCSEASFCLPGTLKSKRSFPGSRLKVCHLPHLIRTNHTYSQTGAAFLWTFLLWSEEALRQQVHSQVKRSIPTATCAFQDRWDHANVMQTPTHPALLTCDVSLQRGPLSWQRQHFTVPPACTQSAQGACPHGWGDGNASFLRLFTKAQVMRPQKAKPPTSSLHLTRV